MISNGEAQGDISSMAKQTCNEEHCATYGRVIEKSITQLSNQELDKGNDVQN